MLVAIISDVHDNIPNLKKVLDYCAVNKVEKIICCGDLGSVETLDFLEDNFQGEIFFTFGNLDDDYLKNYPFEKSYHKNIRVFKNYGEAEIGGKKISFVHFPREAVELCDTGKFDLVFHGHTHKPWTEKRDACLLLNPGNVANQMYPPTFAVWNVEEHKFNLIRINELK